jgi:hypothetical protein
MKLKILILIDQMKFLEVIFKFTWKYTDYVVPLFNVAVTSVRCWNGTIWFGQTTSLKQINIPHSRNNKLTWAKLKQNFQWLTDWCLYELQICSNHKQ